MKLIKKVLLTIGREYGSGGRASAEALAKDLDIPLFDKNMISMIVKKHGYDEEALTSSDEHLSNPFFDPYVPYGFEAGTISEKLFMLQSNIIKEQADKGSAIFVGRCANDVLRKYDNVVNVFIYADKKDRVKRIMAKENLTDEATAEKLIKKMDKTRRAYYQFYTDKKWATPDGMDLMIKSSGIGVEGVARLIESYLVLTGYAEA